MNSQECSADYKINYYNFYNESLCFETNRLVLMCLLPKKKKTLNPGVMLL
jgi:hypothetical protein